VISVDTKKKELIGNFKNGGREWQPKGDAETVLVHDFPQDAIGKAVPYGIYDMGRNEAWVNVGKSCDTAQFAVASIRRWWTSMGKKPYPPHVHGEWNYELPKMPEVGNLIRISVLSGLELFLDALRCGNR
jgi:hypothetical protein